MFQIASTMSIDSLNNVNDVNNTIIPTISIDSVNSISRYFDFFVKVFLRYCTSIVKVSREVQYLTKIAKIAPSASIVFQFLVFLASQDAPEVGVGDKSNVLITIIF